LDVTDSIRFFDFTDDPFSFLRHAKMCVLCSRNEAFGRVIVESMKVNVPVIVPDTGSGPDLVVPGKTGLIYHFGDPDSLAEKIECYLNDEKVRLEIAANSNTWALQNFNEEKHAMEMHQALTGTKPE
jgi:glycosyltransferase involved in cell wall biosynthesis